MFTKPSTWKKRTQALTNKLNRNHRAMNKRVLEAFQYNEETDEEVFHFEWYGYVEQR